MFDPDISYNSLPSLPPIFNFEDIDIFKALLKTSRELSNLDGQLLAAFSNYTNSYLFINPYYTPEAVASAGIENIITTTKEVFEAKVLPLSEQTEAQKETLSYEAALSLGQELLIDKGFLGTNDFIKLQKLIAPEKAGIRNMPGYKVMNENTRKVYYSPPEGSALIRQKLKDFENYYNSDDTEDGLDPLIKVALLHYQFEAIHPFKDGNGRTGRLIMPLYLNKSKILSFPVLFLSGYIIKNKSQYYELLRRVTSHGEWKPWVLFILKAIEEQSHRTWKTLRDIRILEMKYEEMLIKKYPSFRRPDMIKTIFIDPVFDVTQFSETLRIHPNTAKKYLDIMVKLDMLTIERYKNTKLYYNFAMLDNIKNATEN